MITMTFYGIDEMGDFIEIALSIDLVVRRVSHIVATVVLRVTHRLCMIR